MCKLKIIGAKCASCGSIKPMGSLQKILGNYYCKIQRWCNPKDRKSTVEKYIYPPRIISDKR